MVVVDMDFVVDPRIIYGLYVLTMLRNTAIGMILASLFIIIIAGIYMKYNSYYVCLIYFGILGMIAVLMSLLLIRLNKKTI